MRAFYTLCVGFWGHCCVTLLCCASCRQNAGASHTQTAGGGKYYESMKSAKNRCGILAKSRIDFLNIKPLRGRGYFLVTLNFCKIKTKTTASRRGFKAMQEFINDICGILGITAPAVSFDTSNFTTNTMFAQCSSDGAVIYLKPFEKLSPDVCFSVAHELRHVWQIKNNKAFYFDAYKPSELCSSLEEYNLQPAEVDANAFAGVIMIGFFHLRPQFNGLPDAVKAEIYNRMEYIKTTL